MRDSGHHEKNEKFILDATLEEMISITAFRAILRNGHRLVAFVPREQRHRENEQLRVGDMIKISLSPFDMSRGQVVFDQGRNE